MGNSHYIPFLKNINTFYIERENAFYGLFYYLNAKGIFQFVTAGCEFTAVIKLKFGVAGTSSSRSSLSGYLAADLL